LAWAEKASVPDQGLNLKTSNRAGRREYKKI
jgi:hypothetical protein